MNIFTTESPREQPWRVRLTEAHGGVMIHLERNGITLSLGGIDDTGLTLFALPDSSQLPLDPNGYFLIKRGHR